MYKRVLLFSALGDETRRRPEVSLPFSELSVEIYILDRSEFSVKVWAQEALVYVHTKDRGNKLYNESRPRFL